MNSNLSEAINQESEVTCPTIDLTGSNKKKQLRILHVDDDQCFLDVSKQILSSENNFQVDTAESVEQALEKIGRQTYDVIISDFEMPIKNGLDFLKELKRAKKDIPFILFTGKGKEDVIINALNLGVDRYISKHGFPEIVYLELSNAIEKAAENKKSKQLLVESELKYRSVVEKSSLGVLIILADPLKIVFANAAITDNLGYSSEEIVLMPPEAIIKLVFQDDRVILFDRLAQRFEGETVKRGLEFRAVRKDGSNFWVEAFSNPIEYNGQLAVLCMFLDIDERKKAEQALRASEERFRELANSLPELVFEFDITGKITFMNQQAIVSSGFLYEELVGQNFVQFISSEDLNRALENVKLTLAGKDLGLIEYNLLRKGGVVYPALVRASPIVSENEVKGIRGLIIDISERKKMMEALQESETHYRLLAEREHVTNEKLNIIGRLTRHDVSNKLSVVKANMYLVKKLTVSNPAVIQYLNAIDLALKQTYSLLDFSRIYERIGTEQLRLIDAGVCFKEALSLFSNMPEIKVVNECFELNVMADSLLKQLFYNLIDNSLKHGKKVSCIRLYHKIEDNKIKLFFEDDGVGISAANKSKIFVEGFTTGEGTGHGLYIVKKMMHFYGWEIKEIGLEGEGVKFEITLPKSVEG